jgi:hypothetical protein
VVADRAGPAVLRDRRRHHVQLRTVLRHGAALSHRRRVLPRSTHVCSRHPVADPPSESGARPR